MTGGRLTGGAVILALAALTAVGLWKTAPERPSSRPVLVRHPEGIMGTACTLAAVGADSNDERAARALDLAENALRSVESRMSTWLADSEVSGLNSAPAEQEVPLSDGTRLVLRAARSGTDWTRGAFDVTCRPLVELWREAGELGRIPTEEEVGRARAISRWDRIELTERGAVKRVDGARVDLGGIAKGYGIDRAARALKDSGLPGGMVDVGGDLICFGRPPEGDVWTVEVKNPFDDGFLGRLGFPCGAVCSSGGYARFVEIEGERYSHIIDPRTGRPADAAAAVTVVACTALMADIWATALSVLGPDGLELLPEGVEALLVLGTEEDHRPVATPGFASLFVEPLPERLEIRP